MNRSHTLRVAIDGVDAAGKTTLANELAQRLVQRGRPVIRTGIDGFHNPRSIRHRRGSLSPEGFYRDSFDFSSIANDLLQPLGPSGSRRYQTRVFDHVNDAVVSSPVLQAQPNAVLLFDGIFLFRPELRGYWDFAIFVKARFDVTLARALLRDAELFGSEQEVVRQYNARYIPGQKIYLRECEPESRADIVIDNDNPDRPSLARE